MHHKNALSLLGVVLDNADSEGKKMIYNLLEHNGVDVGNNARNLINLQIDDHDVLHNYAREMGWEMQGKGTKGLAKTLAESTDIQTTLDALQTYIDVAIPALRNKQDDLIQARELAYEKAKAYKDSSVIY